MENMQRGYRPAAQTRSAQDNAQKTLPVLATLVPQQLNAVYDTDKALERGTLFPELDKPWLGGAVR